jgi:plastocyanin
MRWMAAVAAFAAVGLAGCGSSSDDSGGGGGGGGGYGGGGAATSADSGVALSAPADGSKKFDASELTAKAGNVKITFDNPSSVPHGVTVTGNGTEAAGDVITGAETSFTVALKPGKYSFYCPVGDHRAEGMEGTITVS